MTPVPPRPPAEPGDRVPTGAPPVDGLLQGGLEPDGLTELYGEGGTGKSVLCLSAAVGVARTGRWVFYIDTEGVSTDRLTAMSGGEPERTLRHLLLSSPKDLTEQTAAVRTTCSLVRDGTRPVGLVVLDSATLHYRLSVGTSDEEEARRALLGQLAELLATSIAGHVPVLFTNQVWRNVTTGALEPLGGSFVQHLAKTILRLERRADGRRKAVLVKHRSLGEAEAGFRITAHGIE